MCDNANTFSLVAMAWYAGHSIFIQFHFSIVYLHSFYHVVLCFSTTTRKMAYCVQFALTTEYNSIAFGFTILYVYIIWMCLLCRWRKNVLYDSLLLLSILNGKINLIPFKMRIFLACFHFPLAAHSFDCFDCFACITMSLDFNSIG